MNYSDDDYLSDDELIVALCVPGLGPVREDPTAMRTSILQGEDYTQEILGSGNPRRVEECLRMNRSAFLELCAMFRRERLLHDSTSWCGAMSVEHKVHIFLYVVSNNASNRNSQERFQHSPSTISKYFHQVLNALSDLAPQFLKLPDTTTPVQVTRNPKFYPFFKDCVGAVDGTLLPIAVPAAKAAAYRCRKGFLAQNVMASCGFDLTFQYVLAGWEGSANDSRVYQDCYTKGWTLPPGKYVLADAGYPHQLDTLVPYRGVRYHLKEWAQGNQRLARLLLHCAVADSKAL